MDESYSEGISIAELLGIVKNHIGLLVIVFVSIVALSVGYVMISTPTYTATTTIAIESTENLVNIRGTRSPSANIVKEIQYLTSRSTVTGALESMDLASYTRKDGSDYSDLLLEEKKLDGVASNITVSETKNSNLVTISFEHADLEFAKAFLGALHTEFDTAMTRLSSEQLDKEHSLLEARLMEAEGNLETSELAYVEFQSNPRYIESVANNESYKNILSFLDVRLQDVGSNAIASDPTEALKLLGIADASTAKLVKEYGQGYGALLHYEMSQLIRAVNANQTQNTDNALQAYRDNLGNAELALLDRLSLLKGQAEAASLLPQITNTVKLSFLAGQKQYYVDSLNEFRSIGMIGDKIQYGLDQYKNEVLQYTNQLKLFDDFRSVSVNPTSLIEPVRIQDLDGNSNNTLVLAVGLLLGLALAFLSVLLYEAISDSLIDEAGVKRVVGDKIPIWSTIPKIKKSKSSANSESGPFIDPKNQAAEAFDRLAGIVQNRDASNGTPIYCFSSLGYGESGDLTVSNLALSIMKNGKKVLMVGANSEEANYRETFDTIVASYPSVITESFEEMDLAAVKNTASNQPLLHLVAIGDRPHELSRILNSEAFEAAMKSASEVYDFILIDGPTFRSPSNLLAVAKNSTGLVLHLRQGITSKKAMTQLLETVSISQVPVIGLVFNAMFGRPSLREKRRIQKNNYTNSVTFSKVYAPAVETKDPFLWTSS